MCIMYHVCVSCMRMMYAQTSKDTAGTGAEGAMVTVVLHFVLCVCVVYVCTRCMSHVSHDGDRDTPIDRDTPEPEQSIETYLSNR